MPSSCEGAIPALPGSPHLSSSINPCLPRVSGPKTTPHWSEGADNIAHRYLPQDPLPTIRLPLLAAPHPAGPLGLPLHTQKCLLQSLWP